MKADKYRRFDDPFRLSGNPADCRRCGRPIAVSSATYAPAATIPTTKTSYRPPP